MPDIESAEVNPLLDRMVKEATGYAVAELGRAPHPLASPLADACAEVTAAENGLRDLAEYARDTADRLAQPATTIDLFPPSPLTNAAARITALSAARSAAWRIADAMIRAWQQSDQTNT